MRASPLYEPNAMLEVVVIDTSNVSNLNFNLIEGNGYVCDY